MTLKSIAALKFVVKPTFNRFNVDPVVSRRNNLVKGLNKQIDLLNSKEGTETHRAWFYPKGTGFVASVRYRISPIELENGHAFFEVPSKTALINIYKAILKEVELGEWDALLEKKAGGMKAGGRKKPLAQAA